MQGRTTNMEIKGVLHASIIRVTLTYASQTWPGMKHKELESKYIAEKSYLRSVCDLNRMKGETNENVTEKFSISFKSGRTIYGVVKVVQCSPIRWLVTRKQWEYVD